MDQALVVVESAEAAVALLVLQMNHNPDQRHQSSHLHHYQCHPCKEEHCLRLQPVAVVVELVAADLVQMQVEEAVAPAVVDLARVQAEVVFRQLAVVVELVVAVDLAAEVEFELAMDSQSDMCQE